MDTEKKEILNNRLLFIVFFLLLGSALFFAISTMSKSLEIILPRIVNVL